jgi:Tfp pilus assembly protein PilX
VQKSDESLNASSGSALIFALVFGVVFSIIGISVMALVSNGSRTLNRDLEIMRNYWAHESALNLACRYISFDDKMLYPNLVDNTYQITSEISPFPQISLNGYLLNFTSNFSADVYQFAIEDNVHGTELVKRSEVYNVIKVMGIRELLDPDGIPSNSIGWTLPLPLGAWRDLLN